MNKPPSQAQSGRTLKTAYEKLYGKSLTSEQVASIRFNLVRYVELLILLDQQHKEWLKQQANK